MTLCDTTYCFQNLLSIHCQLSDDHEMSDISHPPLRDSDVAGPGTILNDDSIDSDVAGPGATSNDDLMLMTQTLVPH